MSKINPIFKKIALAVMVLAIGLAAFPVLGASAASLDPATATPADNTRLELNWARAQAAYDRIGGRLDMADKFEARIQSLINKAKDKGWDTTAVQAAFDAFTAVIPAAQVAHDPGAAIIAGHAGFDANGNVIDRTTAIDTLTALVKVNQDTRAAMNGTGLALRSAIRAFIDAHRSTR